MGVTPIIPKPNRKLSFTMRPANQSTPAALAPHFLYVNHTENVLGNSVETAALLDFATAKKITQYIFYTGDLLSNTDNRGYMRELATSLAGMNVRVAKNVTKASVSLDLDDPKSVAAYNRECTAPEQRFTKLVQEGEPWHANNSFASFDEYAASSELLYAYCRDNGFIYDGYIARCEDVAGVRSASYIADWLVAHYDTIYLVDYVSNTKFQTYHGLSDGIKAQIQLIANAAKKANKVQKISILWASEGNAGANMRTTFVANPTLLPVYAIFAATYVLWNYTNKSSIKFIGQTIYASTGVKDL